MLFVLAGWAQATLQEANKMQTSKCVPRIQTFISLICANEFLFHPSLQLLCEEVWEIHWSYLDLCCMVKWKTMSGVDFCLRSRKSATPWAKKIKAALGTTCFLRGDTDVIRVYYQSIIRSTLRSWKMASVMMVNTQWQMPIAFDYSSVHGIVFISMNWDFRSRGQAWPQLLGFGLVACFAVRVQR